MNAPTEAYVPRLSKSRCFVDEGCVCHPLSPCVEELYPGTVPGDADCGFAMGGAGP